MKTAVIVIVAAAFFALESAIKHDWLALWPETFQPIIGDWLVLRLVKNSGIAFSLPLGALALPLFPVIAVILAYWLAKKIQAGEDVAALAALLVIAGALSNWLDRLTLGFVVDYISIKYFSVFNLADAAITCGLTYLALTEIFCSQKAAEELDKTAEKS